MQNEWAGAQAFSSFDTYLAPFVKVDNLTQKEVKQCIQSFVFGVNTPSRWGTQAPFSNITLDWTVPKDLENLPAIVGGKEQNFTYGDCKKEMDMANKAFIEIMTEGDANGRGFQYPIPTYSITKDFDWSDTENNRLLFEMTAKYGTPYFSNYINSDMEPSDVRSMCCRLRLDLRELRKKSGGFFGSGESTGSVGVVTINLPRIAYLSKTPEEFYQRLDKIMDIAARSLKIKRTVITRLMDAGLYPYTKYYLGTFENHFSTIGLIGMNEVGLNARWLRKDLTHPETQAFAKDVLNHMRERLSDYQEQYGDLYNLEATPAESTTYRLAKHDVEKYPDIITAAKNPGDTPYYTNSSHLPVGYTADIFDALAIQDELQTLYTSGTVFHAFLGEKLPDWKAAADLVRKIAENFKLPYYTMSPTYSICQEHGYLSGEHTVCPKCGKPCEVWSRITGYYRPVQNWNDGKVQEFKDRREYDVENSRLEGRRLCDREDTAAPPPSPPPTVWPSTTWRSTRTSSPPPRIPATPPTIPTPPTCPWATPPTSSTPWPSRTSCRPSTPPAPCSTPSWARSCRTGKPPPIWCARSPRTSSCPTTPCPPPTPSARSTAISPANTPSAPSAASLARCGAASPATTAPSRTGTTARSRSSRTAGSTTWKTPAWRAAACATGRTPPPIPARPLLPLPRTVPTGSISSPPRPAPTARLPKTSWTRPVFPMRCVTSASTWIW